MHKKGCSYRFAHPVQPFADEEQGEDQTTSWTSQRKVGMLQVLYYDQLTINQRWPLQRKVWIQLELKVFILPVRVSWNMLFCAFQPGHKCDSFNRQRKHNPQFFKNFWSSNSCALQQKAPFNKQMINIIR